MSTHSFGELAAALGLERSYISLGPVFSTISNKVNFGAQGVKEVTRWRAVIQSHIPLVVIDRIADADKVAQVR
jgi:thiamine monophosphate synthase